MGHIPKEMLPTLRDYSDLQEKYLEKLLKGKIQSNSGGTKFGGGDVCTKTFLIEAKTVCKEAYTFSVKREWLGKARKQAFEQGKQYWAVAFQYMPRGLNYFIIDERLFVKFKDFMEGE